MRKSLSLNHRQTRNARFPASFLLKTAVLRFGLTLALVLTQMGCLEKTKTETSSEGKATAAATAHEDPEGFYTCPMDPEVHQHEPGNCPICGMRLTKVPGTAAAQPTKPSPSVMSGPTGHEGHGVAYQPRQLELAGIARHTVERRDLEVRVLLSGRLGSPREVSFQLFESDLAVIAPGVAFAGSTAVAPEQTITGKIRRIDTLLDPSSRTVRATGELATAPKQFIVDGAFHGEARVMFKSQVVVPHEAVLHAGAEDLVYVFAGEKLTPQPVKLGVKGTDGYQILSGLEAGAVISSGPNFLLDSEAKIRGSNRSDKRGESGHAHH